MKKKMLLILLAVAVSVSMIAAATMAWFTADDDAGEATFTAGILSVDVSKGVEQFLECDTIDHMNPGDEFGPITIEIVNDGTKKLAWFGNWQFSFVDQLNHVDGDKLLDALYIKSMKMEMLDEDGQPWSSDEWYDGHYFILNGIGNDIGYNSGEAVSFNNLITNITNFNRPVITLRDFNDNTTMGSQPFEHMGALKPGNKYRLTVEIAFHEEAGNEYQGDRDNVSPIRVGFEVKATQINADAINAEIAPGFGTHVNWLNDQIAVQP
mgnify:FL=1